MAVLQDRNQALAVAVLQDRNQVLNAIPTETEKKTGTNPGRNLAGTLAVITVSVKSVQTRIRRNWEETLFATPRIMGHQRVT